MLGSAQITTFFVILSLSLSGPPSFSLVHLAANGNSIQKFGQGQIVQEVHTHTHMHTEVDTAAGAG